MSISSFAKNSLDQNGSKKKIVDWKIDLYNEVNCNCVKLSGKRGYLTIFCNDIFAQGDIDIFFAEKFKGSHFEFFVENISRGNPVQILLNFPAKSLSIYLNKFFSTSF